MRGGECDQSRLAASLRLSRCLQTMDRLDQRRDPACRTRDGHQSARSLPGLLVFHHRAGASTQSRTSEAIVWFDKVHRLMPHYPLVHAWLAAACAQNGQIERARAELAEARGLSRDGRYSNIARLKAAEHFGVAEMRNLAETIYFAGLRKAGMPDE